MDTRKFRAFQVDQGWYHEYWLRPAPARARRSITTKAQLTSLGRLVERLASVRGLWTALTALMSPFRYLAQVRQMTAELPPEHRSWLGPEDLGRVTRLLSPNREL
jgi:hypothetical protein